MKTPFRFDHHILWQALKDEGIIMKTLKNGTTILIGDIDQKGANRIKVKDSYRCAFFSLLNYNLFRLIPIALAKFKKTFKLDCASKPHFPYLYVSCWCCFLSSKKTTRSTLQTSTTLWTVMLTGCITTGTC